MSPKEGNRISHKTRVRMAVRTFIEIYRRPLQPFDVVADPRTGAVRIDRTPYRKS